MQAEDRKLKSEDSELQGLTVFCFLTSDVCP
jgi:hypothetical protein